MASIVWLVHPVRPSLVPILTGWPMVIHLAVLMDGNSAVCVCAPWEKAK